jgi:hypothetical protein
MLKWFFKGIKDIKWWLKVREWSFLHIKKWIAWKNKITWVKRTWKQAFKRLRDPWEQNGW